LSGQVLVGKQGLRNAQVVLTDQQGNSRSVFTGTFGYYHFDDLTAGETYVIQVISKRYQFNAQIVTPFENIAELNLTAETNY
jgi:hypothetical protein